MVHFSIITITKNNPDGFGKTKQSVVSQKFTDYEWIVIDGDKEPDNGIYDAMNKGIDRATGHYVIFMNAGDVFADENTLNYLSHYNADFIYGDSVDKKSKHHMRIKNGMITHHQAIVYRRVIIDDLRYDETYSLAADYKFTLEFMARANSVLKLDIPICIFELGGLSQQNAKTSRHQEIDIRKELNISAPFTPYRQWVAQLLKTHTPFLFDLHKKLFSSYFKPLK